MRATAALAIVPLLAPACVTPRPSSPPSTSPEPVSHAPQGAEPSGEEPSNRNEGSNPDESKSQETAGSGANWTSGAAPSAGSDGVPIHGSFATRFRGRRGGGDHDSDLYELLTLDVRDSRRDPWSAHIVAEGAFDLDGRANPSSPFFSLQDTQGDRFTSRLYEAYVESRAIPGLELVRLGRQIDFELPVIVTFDGLDVESREIGPSRVAVGAYGGALSRVYTSAESGNTVLGAFVEAKPWEGGRTRIDWMHLEDATLLGEHRDDLAALSVGQSLGPEWRVDGTYSRLESESRDASLRATYADIEGDLTVQASWYRLLETQNDLALELDPFTTVLLEQSPYTEGRIVATKSFGPDFQVEAGADVRRVSSSEDVAEFNRDFERWYATTTFDHLLPANIALSLTGEVWDAESDRVRTWGVDLSRQMSARLRASVGSYYSLYKYDLFLLSERDDVRTYYLKLRFKGGSAWSWDARYEHEDSFENYDTLRLGVTWHF